MKKGEIRFFRTSMEARKFSNSINTGLPHMENALYLRRDIDGDYHYATRSLSFSGCRQFLEWSKFVTWPHQFSKKPWS